MYKLNRATIQPLLRAVLMAGLGAFVTNIYAASFDCTKAETKVEHLICDTSALSKLDDELAAAYKTALADPKRAGAATQAQKAWLKERDACQETLCVQAAYQKRMTLLTTPPGAIKGWWIFRNGYKNPEPLCKALLKRLAYYDPNNSGCSYDVLLTYPEFTDPPWQELDPKEHRELVAKLLKYGQEGADGYFHRLPGLPEVTEAGYRARAKSFIEKEHGRLRMVRLRLVSSFDNGRHPAPPGEQTIIQMSTVYQRSPGECKQAPQPLWNVGTYLVTPDLSGPDPNMHSEFTPDSSTIKIYNGKPMLIGKERIDTDYMIGLENLCDYEFVNKRK